MYVACHCVTALVVVFTFCVDRNLSFQTDEDSLASFMSQFGDLVYCCVVVDATTEHSKGKLRIVVNCSEQLVNVCSVISNAHIETHCWNI